MGSWFHALGAAQEKDRLPILVREVGRLSSNWSEDRRLRVGQ